MQLFKTATFEMAFVVCFGACDKRREKMDRESDRDRLQRSHKAMPIKKVIMLLPVVQSLPQQTALTSTFRASLTTNRCG